MLFITGDVHTKMSQNFEQAQIGSEVKASYTYLSILKRYSLASTLFINGKCLKDEKENINALVDFNVELGGHTYDNFHEIGAIKGYVYRKLFGCVYGPATYQRKDIAKTKKEFINFGVKMNSWRTHAFSSNDKTFEILAQEGVRYVSDLLGNRLPFEKRGIVHLPINIPVDQNTIAYSLLTPENRDPFASCVKGRIAPEEWFAILRNRVIKNEKNKVPSILLMHPATMATLDNFKLFERIAEFLSRYKSAKISEYVLD